LKIDINRGKFLLSWVSLIFSTHFEGINLPFDFKLIKFIFNQQDTRMEEEEATL
jgi:hypothetical protein